MKRRGIIILIVCVFVGVIAGTGHAVEAPSIKQALLIPKGFDLEWLCGARSGHSRVIFLEEEEKIIAEIRVIDIENVDINNPVNFGAESCSSYAKLTDKGIIFYGCNPVMWDIPLAYDPGDTNTPFKGSGRECAKISLIPW